MPRRKVLITGASGYLGQHLTPQAANYFDVYAAYHTQPDKITSGQPLLLNLINPTDVLTTISDLKPEAIIHTAAINPGGNEQLMQQINVNGSQAVAEAATATGARLVHISSDVVHDGKNAPYNDDAVPNPLNTYAKSKAMAEVAVAKANPPAVMVRTSLIYGLTVMDRSTAGFAERIRAGEQLLLFSDVIRQPVWVSSLAEALLKLVDIEVAGPLNVVGSQVLTRAEYGRRMLDWWQIDTQGLLGSGKAADVSAKIPLDLRMSTHKAEQLLQMAFPGIDEVIDNFIGSFPKVTRKTTTDERR